MCMYDVFNPHTVAQNITSSHYSPGYSSYNVGDGEKQQPLRKLYTEKYVSECIINLMFLVNIVE
jgi:hypothetical protein